MKTCPRPSRRRLALAQPRHGIVVWLLLGSLAFAAHAQGPAPDLSSFSLDSLTTMEITSVARKEQKLTEAAGAIFVITSEDIRRSGMSNVAELLRTVPGLDVAEMDANKWAITTRGFNGRYSTRTLFLLDGRALYTPLTSGVDWDAQDIFLADIDRIEVIRGPGATLWGANAMDGVVNIITKSSKDTQGALLVGRLAVQDRESVAARFGGAIGSRGHYRLYTKYIDQLGSVQPQGGPSPDSWRDVRAGFRTDWDLGAGNALVVEANLFSGHDGQTTLDEISIANPLGKPFPDQSNTSGGDVLARWTKTSPHFDTSALGYFDLDNRHELGELGDYRHSFDLEFDQHYHSSSHHDLSWGANARDVADRTVGSLSLSFNPAIHQLPLYGVYAQDEISLVPGKWKLIAGSKVEHNAINGFVFLPNGRLMWIPGKRASLWASVARAASTPSRLDTDGRVNATLETLAPGKLALLSLFGTHPLAPETVVAYEFGVRLAPHPKVSFDLATFYNQYSHFHTNEPGTPFLETGYAFLPAPHMVQPAYTESNNSGMSRGAELLVETHPSRLWKITASYTAMLISIHPSALSKDFQSAANTDGSTPRNQFQVHSQINLTSKVDFDAGLFYVGKLTFGTIQPYTRFDLRAEWRPAPNIELSAGGRNLFQDQHYEFGSGGFVQTEPISRSAYLNAVWSF